MSATASLRVAQIFNLLYRSFANCRATDAQGAFGIEYGIGNGGLADSKSAIQQSATRLFSALELLGKILHRRVKLEHNKVDFAP